MVGWDIYINEIRALSANPFYNYENFIILKKQMIGQGYIFPPLTANEYDLYSSQLFNLTLLSGGLEFPVFTIGQIEYILMPIGDYINKSVTPIFFIAFIALFILISKA